MAEVTAVTEQNFDQEVLKSEIPVLVDFWAPWCGPCRAVAPVVEKVAGDLAGKLKTVKCNVDEQQALAAKYGIRSIPSLLFFRKGEVVESVVGFLPEAELKKHADRLVA